MPLLDHVPVSLGALTQTIFPHLWAITTSVRQASTGTIVEIGSGLTGTPSGTDRGVVPLAPAVSSTHHRGSM